MTKNWFLVDICVDKRLMCWRFVDVCIDKMLMLFLRLINCWYFVYKLLMFCWYFPKVLMFWWYFVKSPFVKEHRKLPMRNCPQSDNLLQWFNASDQDCLVYIVYASHQIPLLQGYSLRPVTMESEHSVLTNIGHEYSINWGPEQFWHFSFMLTFLTDKQWN